MVSNKKACGKLKGARISSTTRSKLRGTFSRWRKTICGFSLRPLRVGERKIFKIKMVEEKSSPGEAISGLRRVIGSTKKDPGRTGKGLKVGLQKKVQVGAGVKRYMRRPLRMKPTRS